DLSGVSNSKQIDSVPFFAQESHQCGPASLAMVLAWAGAQDVRPDTLASEIYLPNKKGSLQMEILGALRRYGFLALHVHSVKGRIKEVAAGHPVLVFENVGYRAYPVLHYAVAVGYDVSKEEI